jgi:hypothetical protein
LRRAFAKETGASIYLKKQKKKNKKQKKKQLNRNKTKKEKIFTPLEEKRGLV